MKRRANIWPFGKGQPLGAKTTHHRRASKRVSAKALATQAKGGESERLERKLGDAQLEAKLRTHYSRGGNLREFLQANPGAVVKCHLCRKPLEIQHTLYRESDGRLVHDYCKRTRAARGNPARHDWDRIIPEGDGARAGAELGRLVNGLSLVPDRNYFMSFVRAWSKAHGVKASDAEQGISQGFRETYRPSKRNPSDEAAARRNAKRPRGLWPQPYEVDEAVNRRAQANPGAWRNDVSYQLADVAGHILAGFQTQAEAFKEAQSLAASGQRIEVVWRGDDGDYRSRWFGKRAARSNPNEGARAFVGAKRKDSKYPVQFVFSGSGRRIQHLLTQEKLDALKASGKYEVYAARGNPSDEAAARGNPKEKSAAYEAGRKALASAASKLGTVNLTPSIAQREDWRHAWKEFMAGWQAEKRRPNPSAAAADVYEEFHGRPSSEVVTVKEKIHYHEHLAALGELRNLVVVARDGAKITLSRFRKAILCTNEAKNQMFVRGGDQSVDLAAFGIRKPHEVETLGRVVELAYFTRKDHLGDEGGTALYFHVAGETNENGKRKMAGWGPDLIYRTLDESLEFSGGSYTIRAEGVDK